MPVTAAIVPWMTGQQEVKGANLSVSINDYSQPASR
jgi:hypothetical protein